MQAELLNFGFLFLFAIIGGFLSSKFKQPLVIGLIIIGAIVGPNLLGLISDASIIDLCIEFGAILSLFVLGMEFSLKKLLKIGLKSGIVALFKVGIMFFIGFLTIIVLGMDTTTAAFTGVALSFSSTMIIINLLEQKNLISRKEVPLLVAVLILEDIFGIIALTFFSAVKASTATAVVEGIRHIIIGLVVLIIVYLIFSKFAERMITYVRKRTSDELTIFISLGLCIGFAYLAYALGLSPSAGAFLAGSVVANFRESKMFEKAVKPHSYMFSAFFFISMGAMVNIKSIFANIHVLIILAIATFFGLFIALGLVTRIFAGFDRESATFSTIAMLPPGIFSLLVAKESLKFGIGIDLVAIVAILMLLHSIVMNLAISKKENKNHAIFAKKSKTIIGDYINSISRFFSSLFTELEIESSYTKEAKKRAGSFITKVLLMVFTAVALTYVIAGIFNNFIDIAAGAIIGILFIWLLYKAAKEFRKIHLLVIRIISTLEAGMNLKRIRRGTKRLLFGSLLVFLGIYSPFVMFMLNLETYFIILPAALIVAGILMYALAGMALSQLTFKYKYTIHSYKKIVLGKARYELADY